MTIPQQMAWLIFTKGMSREPAERQVRVTRDADVGLHVLSTIAIVG